MGPRPWLAGSGLATVVVRAHLDRFLRYDELTAELHAMAAERAPT